ncbi:hypothetical protein TWF281_003745 [Arthrobotrys megalospora]
MYQKEGVRCIFGPLDFTIGIKAADGTIFCSYIVNRDVSIALSTKIELELEREEKTLGRELSELYLALEPEKKPLLEAFAHFLNEGNIISPRYENVQEPDTLLFLYSFADLLGCGLLKVGLIRYMTRNMHDLLKQLEHMATERGYLLDSEIMEWVNCFYECSSEKEVEEYKLWDLVEKALGGYGWNKMKLAKAEIEEYWDDKFKSQILQKRQLTEVGEVTINFAGVEGLMPDGTNFDTLRSAEADTDAETENEDEVTDFEDSDGPNDDFCMEDADELFEQVVGIRAGVMSIELTTNEMDEGSDS